MISLVASALVSGALSLAGPSACAASQGSAIQQPSIISETYCPVEDFKACGGDLVGTWDLKAQCTEPGEKVPCEFPFDGEPSCQSEQDTVSCSLNVAGSLTFDSRSVRVVRTEEILARYTFSAACTQSIRAEAEDAKARCEALSRAPIMTCEFVDDLCTCNSKLPGEPMDETIGYRVNKGVLSFGEFTANYCANKDGLTLQFDPHPMSWRYWVLK